MKICVFGDSVTYAGYIKNSWTDLLRWYLEKTLDNDVEFFNLGINGNTSEDILVRFETEASARQPDKVIFAFGINDSCYIFRNDDSLINEDTFRQNINKLINLAKKHTNDITFVGLVLGDDSMLKPFPESSKGKPYDPSRAKKFDAYIKEIATKENCKYIYLYDKLDYEDFVDGLHPNENGHRKMFKVIKDNL